MKGIKESLISRMAFASPRLLSSVCIDAIALAAVWQRTGFERPNRIPEVRHNTILEPVVRPS